VVVSQALPIVPAALQTKLLEMNAHYRADGVAPVDWAAAYRVCVSMQVWAIRWSKAAQGAMATHVM
jgi:hypothetical protein